jgi:hypothetical protein
VALFGSPQYEPENARWGEDISFEDQLQGLAAMVKSGKVGCQTSSTEGDRGSVKWPYLHCSLSNFVTVYPSGEGLQLLDRI